ncbi:MAG TPA: hypothetical protein VGR89_12240 [Puia sp.]|nr:hypothetical protein [Puia sp.]
MNGGKSVEGAFNVSDVRNNEVVFVPKFLITQGQLGQLCLQAALLDFERTNHLFVNRHRNIGLAQIPLLGHVNRFLDLPKLQFHG